MSTSFTNRRSPLSSAMTGGLFTLRHKYADALDEQRAITLLTTPLFLSLAGLVVGVILVVLNPALYPANEVLIPLAATLVVCVVIYLLIQSGRLLGASLLFVGVLVVLPIALNWTDGLDGPGMLGLALPVVAASLLFPPRWAFSSVLPASGALAILLYKYIYITPDPSIVKGTPLQSMVSRLIEASIYLVIVAAVTGQFNLTLQRWATNAQRRARQLEAAALISEAASTAPTVGTLLNLVVERIRETFGFYHAQVFLVDGERRMARLEASTGRAGVALLARGHALPVGSRSVIGQTTYSGKAVVINDVRDNPTHRPNELLPDTLSEMALPLIVTGDVIGALDVQSTRPNSFQDEDINSLQVIASLLAGFIEKARLVNQLQVRAAEQQSLVDEAQNNLRQIEDLNRRLTREGWNEYLRAHRDRGNLGYTLDGSSVQADTTWTAPMRQAYQGEKSVVIRQDQQAHIAALPLRVRGEVIGVLEIERDGTRPWSDDDIAMAETLIDRLALAVENARLYEQATLAAEREHIVNRIAQNVQEAESVDDILRAALSDLSTVLGASRGIVQISPRDDGSLGS
jgi:GAF domain-containing protein